MTILNTPRTNADEQPLDTALPALTTENGRFFRFGRPHRILSGSVHYFRIHPQQWADRLARVAAMGLNTVDTYVPWNFHERNRGDINFSGWRDIGRFIELASDAGLDVIVRPGPYICAEWDNGGLPSWVTRGRSGFARSSNDEFTQNVECWFNQLLPIIESRQSSHGGPIVAVQVENEYGSYGDDERYLTWLRQVLLSHGITELLYTADGPTELMLDGGTLDDTLATVTLGSRVISAKKLMQSRRPNEPFFCAEFWNGWFDHWGEQHHTRDSSDAACNLEEIIDTDGSVSIYMAHGGTNFGLWSGANIDGSHFQPTVTSYDSDAPVSENGALTPKFHAMRRVILGDDAAQLPSNLLSGIPFLPERSVPVVLRQALLPSLRGAAPAVSSASPCSFEDLGLDAGLLLYRARPTLPQGQVTIRVVDVRDRAQVFVDGVPIGVIDRNAPGDGLIVEGRGRPVNLEILVENQGRINYGHRLGEGKGILGGVLIDRRLVHQWEQTPITLADFTETEVYELAGTGGASKAGPEADNECPAGGIAEAFFDVDTPADSFLALPGFGKGFVWINGFLLGRYWEVGPQITLYLPAPLLRKGRNRLTILELERFGTRVELRGNAELGEEEEYVETF